ncbi:MAG: flagellar brake protein [Methylobacter sp.]|nr:flagellar brake protein [Methylobacter sp.]
MSEATSYSINNPRQIIQNLTILIKNKCLLSVRFGEGKAFFLTAILEIDEANKAIIFDYGSKDALNQQLLKADRIIFEADFSGIKVSFKGNMLTQALYNGQPAFTMPIPELIFWMQRREFFRIKSPRSKGSYCLLIREDEEPIKLLLYDISLTGFSVLNTSTEISNLLVSGAQFEDCRLVLSEVGEDTVSIKICAKLIINPDKIAALKIQKIGCLFTRISPMFESTVQRYINQLQRESIQKQSERE